jgi:hypothetical protein
MGMTEFEGGPIVCSERTEAKAVARLNSEDAEMNGLEVCKMLHINDLRRNFLGAQRVQG